jgi:hypothetical protein
MEPGEALVVVPEVIERDPLAEVGMCLGQAAEGLVRDCVPFGGGRRAVLLETGPVAALGG